MKTQSPDTSMEAEQVLIGMVRKAPVSRRFAFDRFPLQNRIRSS